MVTQGLLVSLIMVFVASSSLRSYCPMYCTCSPKRKDMTCNGRGGLLTYIPKPPTYVKNVILTNINLSNLTLTAMKNLSFCNLTSLSFDENNITGVTVNAFSDLNYLMSLHWKQSFLPLSNVIWAATSKMDRLTNLSLVSESVKTKSVSAEHFLHLGRLQNIQLRLGELEIFDTKGLGHLKSLKVLDIGNNELNSFDLSEVLPSLKTLTIDANNLMTFPNLCSGNARLAPELKELNLKNNAIRRVHVKGITCLKKLGKMDLSQNRIEVLRDNTFSELLALKYLKLSSLTSLQKISDLAFNSSSLQVLMFNLNPTLTRKKINPREIFAHMPNLKVLDLTNTRLKIDPAQIKALLLTLKNIEHLTLQRVRLEGLPVGVFSHLRNLKQLTMSGNYLSGWDKDVFANVTSIKKIIFDGCNIGVVNETSFPLEFRLSVREISLANNPFTCTCDLLWFRTWLGDVVRNKSIKFTQYPHRYECRSPNTIPLRLIDFRPTPESCTVTMLYTVILTIILVGCIVFTVTALVVYRYRWYILYWISLMRRRRQRQRQRDNDDAEELIRYDGFVSYSNPDWEWVSTELMEFLEGQLQMRLCEHSRDFSAGKLIVDNVIDAIDSSRKTILVISNEYMKSDWCQFELQMALDSFLKQEIELVVVLLEQIKSRHVTGTLRALMVSTTYIEWSDEGEAKRLFREKLKNAMNDE